MRNANLNAFHNTVRKLYNVEWAQLDFLTEVQKDNFFANPPKFFIAADDETAEKLWDVMHPKAPDPVAGEKRGNVIWPRDWLNRESVDFEYDTGRVIPLTTGAPATPPWATVTDRAG